MNIQRETSGHIAAIVTILIWGDDLYFDKSSAG